MVAPEVSEEGDVNTGAIVVPATTVIAYVSSQPSAFVYVIVVDPIASPVITPSLFTEAIFSSEDIQGLEVAAVVVAVNVI